MKSFRIFFTRRALKDLKLLSEKEKRKLQNILSNVISPDPFRGKKLMGECDHYYSYRLNLKDRIVYTIDKKAGMVCIRRARTHYGN